MYPERQIIALYMYMITLSPSRSTSYMERAEFWLAKLTWRLCQYYVRVVQTVDIFDALDTTLTSVSFDIIMMRPLYTFVIRALFCHTFLSVHLLTQPSLTYTKAL